MKKLSKAVVTLVCVVGLVIMFGCAAFQDLATICHIDEAAIEYSDVKPTSYLPWTTLWDAQRLRKEIIFKHNQLQVVYTRLQEDDNILVGHVLDVLDVSIAGAQEFRDNAFNPQGAIGLLVPTLFAGTLGSLLIKRPGDKSKKELETKT